jgi:hypothetical protein
VSSTFESNAGELYDEHERANHDAHGASPADHVFDTVFTTKDRRRRNEFVWQPGVEGDKLISLSTVLLCPSFSRYTQSDHTGLRRTGAASV